MDRTTTLSRRLAIVVYGLDDKPLAKYEVYGPGAAFADLANTLDSLRGKGLQSEAEIAAAPKPVAEDARKTA